MENNVIFNLKQSIGIGVGRGFRVRISKDYETGNIIDTSGEIVSVVLKNATQIERFEAIFSGGYMTIQKRGLSKNKNVTEEENLKKQWNEGEIGYITILSHNIFDANKSNIIKSGQKIYFGGKGAYITSDDNGQNLKFKDERNQEINLSQISEKTGQNNKVAIGDSDTPDFLKNKLGRGFRVGNKVDVDLSRVDNSNIATQILGFDDYILLANGKKAKIRDLLALEEDLKNSNSSKIVTSNFSGGELVLYESEELLYKDTGFRGSSWDGSNFSELGRKTCLYNGTYKVGCDVSGTSGWGGSIRLILERKSNLLENQHEEQSINYNDKEVIAVFKNVKKGDIIKVLIKNTIYVSSFNVYGFLQRKIIKSPVE